MDNHSSSFLDDGTILCGGTKVLSFSDAQLLFELTTDGDRTPPQTTTVSNTGTGRVTIKDVKLVYGQQDFSLVNAGSFPEYLDPGEEFEIVADFTARVDGIAVGIVEIYTNETNSLPYVVSLTSRTQRVPAFNDLYQDLFTRIQNEAGVRLAQDNLVKSTLRGEYNPAISNEINNRVAGDNAQTAAREALDIALRALITSVIAAEAATRLAKDNELAGRLGLVEQNQTSGSVFGVDLYARQQLLLEITARENAISSEVTARLLLATQTQTNLTNATAAIETTLNVLTSNIESQAGIVTNIQANYQSAGQVNTIVNSKVLLESIARSTAISAEAANRVALAAALRSETDSKVGAEAISRTAALLNEQTLRIAADATNASNILSMGAQTQNTRGITPNGNFQAGAAGWISGMQFLTDNNGVITPTSQVGQYNVLYSAKPIFINTKLAYQINCAFQVFVAACKVYVAIRCYDVAGNHLGNIYCADANGQSVIGTKEVKNVLSGTQVYPVPTFRTGNHFPVNTTKIELAVLANYPDPSPVASSYVKVTELFLSDITNAYDVDARLTEESLVRSTQNEAMSLRMLTMESSYTSARADIDILIGSNGTNANNIILANARIDNEQITRANAILAEATRVDTLLASYSTIGATTTAINAAVGAEASARASAIGAEATRVDNLLTQYTKTTGMNTAISTAVSAEATSRTTAISNAMSAEVTRVNNLLASYTTTSGMNSAISTAVSAEATNRTSAISTAMASEVTRVNNLLASYTTTSGMNSAISTAVNAEVTSRNSAIASAVASEASRVDGLLASYSTTGAMNSAISSAVSSSQTVLAGQISTVANNLTTLTSTYNGKVATIDSSLSTLATRAGVLEARGGLKATAGGVVSAITVRAVSGNDQDLSEITLDAMRINVGTGKLVYNNGSIMRVQGTGFGASGDLIDWYGPTMAINSCSRSNAIFYLSTNGDAYFGGSLSAGVLKYDVTGVSLSATAEVVTDDYVTNGGPKNIIVGYEYNRSEYADHGTGGFSGGSGATIYIYRWNGSGWTYINQLTVGAGGGTVVQSDPGVPDRIIWSMGGSVTFSDTTPAGTCKYRVLIVSRTLPTFSGSGITGSEITQRLSFMSVEE